MRLPRQIPPAPLRTVVKRLLPASLTAFGIRRVWRRDDPLEWSVPERRGEQGLEQYEYSLFSQNGEDGILRRLYSQIGFGSRRFLEFGFEPTESNSLRLALKEGFGGLFIDGSPSVVSRFNRAARSFGLVGVRAVHRFLDLDNLEPTIRQGGLPAEIDLLSIDVDGNDYWFWEGIRCLSARIVVIEYNASLGPERSCSVPYDPLFDRHRKHASGFYCGASLAALERLGRRRGYSLVGCDSNGVNAFFVREDCLTPELTELTSQSAFRPHKNRIERGFSPAEQLRMIEDMAFVDI